MGEHLGAVLGRSAPSASIHSAASRCLRPRRARDLAVGDVADEHVAEDVLALARHGDCALAAQELLPLERVEQLLELRSGCAADRLRARRSRAPPDHRRVLDDAFSSGASASRRAAMMPCTVSGSGSSRAARSPARPRPSMRTYSSA